MSLGVDKKLNEIVGSNFHNKYEDINFIKFMLDNGPTLEELEVINKLVALYVLDSNDQIKLLLSRAIFLSPNIKSESLLILANNYSDVLQYSPALTDEDIIQFIKSSKDVSKLQLITKRKCLGKECIKQLINKQNYSILLSLLQNKNLCLDIETYTQIIITYSQYHVYMQHLLNDYNKGNMIDDVIANIPSNIAGLVKKELDSLGYKLKKHSFSFTHFNIHTCLNNSEAQYFINEIKNLYYSGELTHSLVASFLYEEGNYFAFLYALSMLTEVSFIKNYYLFLGAKRGIRKLLVEYNFDLLHAVDLSSLIYNINKI